MNRKLDRETIAQYELKVVASVRGNNETATCRVHVKVVDANDNAPVFERSSYSAVVYENITVGSRLLQVTINPFEGFFQCLKFPSRLV